MNTTSNNCKKTDRRSRKKCGSRLIILLATALIITGYLLMAGPGSTEDAFNPDIFSSRRIVIAPTLCLAGYLMIIIGILQRTGQEGRGE